MQETRLRDVKRILVDASYTSKSLHVNGVQRVVRNLGEALPGASRVAVQTVRYDGSGGFAEENLAESGFSNAVRSIRRDLRQSLPQWYTRLVDKSLSLLPSKPARAFEKQLLPPAGRSGIFNAPLRSLQWLADSSKSRTPVKIAEGDLLLLPDAYWAYSQIWPAIEKVRNDGAYVVSVLYDLIPLTHREFSSAYASDRFEHYLNCLIRHSDQVVAISDAVRRELCEFCVKNGVHIPDDRLGVFELGADFKSATGDVRQKFRELFEAETSKPYLMVSSFEPRKNHRFLLEAFKAVWEVSPETRLCLIGRAAGADQSILREVEQHPKYQDRLFIFKDATDSELAYCYTHCSAVCYPSVVEGFGLPIVEALWHGAKVFASATPVHLEVGQQACEYFRLDEPCELAKMLLNWSGGMQLPSPSAFRPTTWQESASSLLRAIEARPPSIAEAKAA